MAYGPFTDSFLIYDYAGRLQNWIAQPGFQFTLLRLTTLSLAEEQDYEFYQGIGFRENSISAALTTSWFKWLDMSAAYAHAILPNSFPAEGLAPFLAGSNNANAIITLHPTTHLRMDRIYYYTRLATRADALPSASLPEGVIFTNHLIRSKINYQFNRDYSFNAILDYNAVLPNNALVASTYAKRADTTLLFTYLPHRGRRSTSAMPTRSRT
jgi:hypothetical protein